MSNTTTTRKQRVDLNAEQRAQVVTQYFQEGVGSGALAEFYDV